jgi:hypothetical protein
MVWSIGYGDKRDERKVDSGSSRYNPIKRGRYWLTSMIVPVHGVVGLLELGVCQCSTHPCGFKSCSSQDLVAVSMVLNVTLRSGIRNPD